MPPIRGISPHPPAAAAGAARRERLQVGPTARAATVHRLAAMPLAPRLHLPGAIPHVMAPIPPDPDHVHAALARFKHLGNSCDDRHTIASLGRIGTENARLTSRLPKARQQMYNLMLRCQPMARGDAYNATFKTLRAELAHLIDQVAVLHQTAITIDERLHNCVFRGEWHELIPISCDFQMLMEQARKALDDNALVSASLEQHLADIKSHFTFKPPVIAPWHLLQPLEVSAADLKEEQCPLSMVDACDIHDPLVLPMGESLQLYGRTELELWLQSSRNHNVDEYLFRNPTSNAWVKLSQLRRLVVVPEV